MHMLLLKLVGDLPTSPEGKEELVQQTDDETLMSLTMRFMRQRWSQMNKQFIFDQCAVK